jgi:hypothetical protein
MRQDSRESRILSGIIGISFSCVMLLIFGMQYAGIANVHDQGVDGTLTIIAKTDEKVGRRGNVMRFYDASVANVRVRIRTGYNFAAGSEHPVIFLPGALPPLPSEFFTDYVIGRKSETTWQIIGREIGSPALWIGGLITGFMMCGGLFSLVTGVRSASSPLTLVSSRNHPAQGSDKII